MAGGNDRERAFEADLTRFNEFLLDVTENWTKVQFWDAVAAMDKLNPRCFMYANNLHVMQELAAFYEGRLQLVQTGSTYFKNRRMRHIFDNTSPYERQLLMEKRKAFMKFHSDRWMSGNRPCPACDFEQYYQRLVVIIILKIKSRHNYYIKYYVIIILFSIFFGKCQN